MTPAEPPWLDPLGLTPTPHRPESNCLDKGNDKQTWAMEELDEEGQSPGSVAEEVDGQVRVCGAGTGYCSSRIRRDLGQLLQRLL